MDKKAVRLLIVEDNPADAELMLRELRRAGLEPEWKRVDTEAEFLASLDPALDIILSDYAMPQFIGLQALELLNQRGLDIPFILVSGTIGEDVAVKAMRDGATDYLLKDRLARLGQAVGHALEQKRIRDERKRAREAVEALTRRHQLILNCAGEGICELDLEGRIIFANPKAVELLGRKAEDLLGKSFHDVVHHARPDETDKAASDPIADSIRNATTHQVTNDVFWRKAGHSFRAEWVCAPTRDEHGAVTGCIVTFKDATEQFMADARLKLQEQQYRLLFETNPNPMWVFDVKTLRVLAVNQAAVAQYGYSVDEFVRLTIKDLRPGEDVPDMETALSSPDAPSHFSGEFRHKRKDGSLIDVEIYSGPVVWEGTRARIVTGIDVTDRRQIQQELRDTTERLSELLAHTPAVIYSLKIEGEKAIPVFVSENMERLLGITAEHSARYEWWLESLHPDDRNRVLEAFDKALRSDGYSIEYRLRHTNGSYHWVDDRNRVLHGANGQPVEVVGVWTDITEQKQAEEILKESERRFREMLENVELISMTLDRNATITFCNDYLLHLTGWKREEVIGANWFEKFIPETDMESKKLFFETIATASIPTHHANPIKTKTGELRDVVWNNTMLRDAAGNIVGTASIGEDVTERKRTEERLREQSDIINRAHDAVIIRDFATEKVTFWNSGAERLYGWSADETIGRPIGELIFASDDHRRPALEILLSTGEFHGELKQVTKDGREIMVDGRATIVRHSDGTGRSVLLIHSDITEQKKLETQLLRAQRLESIGTLASGVAHDLNNVLTPILMCAEVLRRGPAPEDLESSVALIEQSARRGAAIVKQVLTFARGIEGERVLIKSSHLLEEMVDIARRTFPKSIDIETKYSEDVWSIEGDPTQLHQVLLNLSVNSRDAMPNGGTLTFAAENIDVDENYAAMTPGAATGSYVMLRISDNGHGMPRDMIDKIFDPFFTTKEIGKGTGLGLSTALGIIKSHGGFISVYSEVGQGTTFKLFLPAKLEEAPPRTVSETPDSLKGKGELILVVDDEPNIVRVTQMILEGQNYRVVPANDGPEAMAKFAQQMDSIRVVLTDVMLPHIDGIALIRAMKKMKPDTLFIASTGHGEKSRATELQSLGVDKFLSKPYDTGQLLSALHNTLT